MLSCQSCPLWRRHEALGVARQITGRCGSEKHVRMARHVSAGTTLSWPVTIENDWCEYHPEFDPANPPNSLEPFWPTLGDKEEIGPMIPAQEFPLRKRMTKEQFQRSLF